MPHRFVCFTDDASQLVSNIEVRLLPNDKKFSGWWWKPYVFKPGHFPDGDINFFIDLDMVIVSNIDKLISFKPEKFVGLEDVGRVFRKVPARLGSAVMRWPANQYADIWKKLEQTPSLANKFHGDQDWIWSLYQTSIEFFPEDWIVSYKWELRNKTELVRVNGRYVFDTVKDILPKCDTCILAFHGTPDPHEVNDPIIVDNWR